MERDAAKFRAGELVRLLITFAALDVPFKRLDEAAVVQAAMPFVLSRGIWLLRLLGYTLSFATGFGAGFGAIALTELVAEFG